MTGVFDLAFDEIARREIAQIEKNTEGEIGHRRVFLSIDLSEDAVKKYIPWSSGSFDHRHYEDEDELNTAREEFQNLKNSFGK